MSLQDQLMAVERGFWTGGPEFYREHVDDECLLAFAPGAHVASREKVADSAAGPRWSDPEIEVRGFLQPTADVTMLSYEASTEREGAPYRALVSSGYVRRDDDWKLAFHQHTPLS